MLTLTQLVLPPKQATSAAGRRSLTAQNAAGALANLTIDNLANRAEALHAQAVPPLVSLLRADCGGAADAARALHNICFQDGRAKAVVGEAGGIGRLVALLESRHAEVAALTLWTLVASSLPNKLALLNTACGLPRLAALTKPGPASAVARMAAGALGEYREWPGGGVSAALREGIPAPLVSAPHEAILSAGGVASLVAMLHAAPEATFGVECVAGGAPRRHGSN